MTAVYSRPEVTRIWAMGLRRLDLFPVVILSKEDPDFMENYQICKKYDFFMVTYPNNPLGEKLNKVISYILHHFEFDYLMNIDSDDLILPQLWDIYAAFWEKNNPFFGIKRVYFFNLKTKETRFSDENCWCAGRCMSRSLLEKMKGSLYFDQDDRGLDQRSAAKVEHCTGIKQTMIETGIVPYILDIKTIYNLNDWNFIQDYSKPCNFDIIEQYYIKNIIRCLKSNTRN